MKHCGRCKSDKEPQEFNKDRSNSDGLAHWCRSCNREYRRALWSDPIRRSKVLDKNKKYRLTDKGKLSRRNSALKQRYGITLAQRDAMEREQNGKCQICRVPFEENTMREAAVDHCHKTSIVRALLCKACNFLIGYSYENAETLRMAADYIERHSWFKNCA